MSVESPRTAVRDLLVLVTDEIETHRLVEAALGSRHVRVMSAVDESLTLAVTRSERPDLIVARVDGGGMDSVAVAQRLKKDAATALIPLLAIVSRAGDLHERAEDAGFDAVLLEPITATTLAQVAALLLERAALRRQQSARMTGSSVTYRCNAGQEQRRDARRAEPGQISQP